MLDRETMTVGEVAVVAPGDPQGRGDSTGRDFDAAPVDELVRRIHGGEMDVGRLPVEVRQRCVGHLTLEGFSCNEIMQLMGMGERMVQRDRAAVRRAGAVGPSAVLGDELLGEYERLTHGSVQRLVRLSRDPDTPAYAKLWAEEAMSRIYQRFVETARRMKYMEEGVRRITRQREDDPAEKERAKRRFRENLAWAKEMLGG